MAQGRLQQQQDDHFAILKARASSLVSSHYGPIHAGAVAAASTASPIAAVSDSSTASFPQRMYIDESDEEPHKIATAAHNANGNYDNGGGGEAQFNREINREIAIIPSLFSLSEDFFYSDIRNNNDGSNKGVDVREYVCCCYVKALHILILNRGIDNNWE